VGKKSNLIYSQGVVLGLIKDHYSENVLDYFESTRMYLEKYASPLDFYPDKHTVFRVNRERSLKGSGMTQFGRAMEKLEFDNFFIISQIQFGDHTTDSRRCFIEKFMPT